MREHFPQLQVLYAETFRDMDFASRPYRLRLEALVKASCARHGLRERLTDNLVTQDAGDEKKGRGCRTVVRRTGQALRIARRFARHICDVSV